ncbi:MAG: ATP-binding cassette domain-containing protein [Pseudobutyrivibrio sp.]|nr:ATP-binding cassette domain-containing protein [Pseudobutyrivibrio sp.]
MVKTRLLKLMGKDSLEVLQEIIWQWIGLLAQLVLVGCIAITISDAFYGITDSDRIIRYLTIAALSIASRLIFIKLHFDAKANASRAVSDKIRREIYGKITRFGNSYSSVISKEKLATMVTDDMAAVDEYYSEFLPRIGYAFLGTITMAIMLGFINARVMFALTFAILVIIIGFFLAKKYEHTVSIKYIIATLDAFTFLGTAIGFKSSIEELMIGNLRLEWAIITMFLCLEIFKPLRSLGELLENGILNAKKVESILSFIDKREPKEGKEDVADEPVRIVFDCVKYSYDGKEVLKSASLLIPAGSLVGLTGPKGSGKSTMAKILTKENRAYKGSVKVNGRELSLIKEEALLKDLTYITNDSHIFRSTVRANLQLGNKNVSEKKMIGALTVVNLWAEIKEMGGLDLSLDDDYILTLGQRQRLLLARALLKNSKVYVFDSITSFIDSKSKDIILRIVYKLAKDMKRTVFFISDEYEDVKGADAVYTLSEGMIDEYGKNINHN